ncbi:hypothetical protein [Convivina intestini]|uniref:hypothetical protein n=1 Tax=Convivina intestini TaxID=1505726 RepID=UPI00200EBF28|nr:hypothetical protein [Convivina intestini]
MKKQDASKILLKLIDNTTEIQSRLNLFADYIRRLVDELQDVSADNIGDELVNLLSTATGEMTGEVNALDNEIKQADEARGVADND